MVLFAGLYKTSIFFFSFLLSFLSKKSNPLPLSIFGLGLRHWLSRQPLCPPLCRPPCTVAGDGKGASGAVAQWRCLQASVVDETGRQQLGFVVLFVLGFELGCCWVLGLVGFGVIWVFSGLLLGLGLG
ncbi:hypothetical protein V6Z11_A05G443000 [Gossypium hirsutum]